MFAHKPNTCIGGTVSLEFKAALGYTKSFLKIRKIRLGCMQNSVVECLLAYMGKALHSQHHKFLSLCTVVELYQLFQGECKSFFFMSYLFWSFVFETKSCSVQQANIKHLASACFTIPGSAHIFFFLIFFCFFASAHILSIKY